MEWHRYLLSNHRNDQSKDDNNIHDDDENDVVGPIKRPWNANNFSKALKLSTKTTISKHYFKNWHEEWDAFQY